ncbi:hypothetical protein ACFE04_004777 [Oxalis oulophora]
MKLISKSLLLLLISLCLSSLLRCAIARGGNNNNNNNNNNTRRLLEEHYSSSSSSSSSTSDDDVANGYMSNSDLENSIKSFVKRCSHISTFYSIGNSVNGIPLWVIEISDKPGVVEPEPAFKFVGNLHGDEPLGRELLMRLANWICDNHAKDPLARLIVDKVHLHILPSMNPDGYTLRRRGNANNIDLNRDFPDQFFPLNDYEEARQPETRAIMNWIRNTRFTASASLHGGALVANYPWDGSEDQRKKYYACPDDRTFRYLSSVYSRAHHNMSLSKEFRGGITNGAAWYPIYGAMQDWNYIYGGCFELTLEISDNKWPSSDELPTLWEYNKWSMLNLVASLVKTGVHGRIFSSDGGKPLPGSIMIKGINYTIKAGQEFADYHRPLAPGETYEVIGSMPGYKPKTTRISLGEEAMSVDFILDPEATSNKALLQNICNCSRDRLVLTEFFWRYHLEVYFLLFLILVFLFFMLKRRTKSNILKHRHLPKRPVVV